MESDSTLKQFDNDYVPINCLKKKISETTKSPVGYYSFDLTKHDSDDIKHSLDNASALQYYCINLCKDEQRPYQDWRTVLDNENLDQHLQYIQRQNTTANTHISRDSSFRSRKEDTANVKTRRAYINIDSCDERLECSSHGRSYHSHVTSRPNNLKGHQKLTTTREIDANNQKQLADSIDKGNNEGKKEKKAKPIPPGSPNTLNEERIKQGKKPKYMYYNRAVSDEVMVVPGASSDDTDGSAEASKTNTSRPPGGKHKRNPDKNLPSTSKSQYENDLDTDTQSPYENKRNPDKTSTSSIQEATSIKDGQDSRRASLTNRSNCDRTSLCKSQLCSGGARRVSFPPCCDRLPKCFDKSPKCCDRSPKCCNRSPKCCDRSPKCCDRSPKCCDRSPKCCDRSPKCCDRSPKCCDTSPKCNIMVPTKTETCCPTPCLRKSSCGQTSMCECLGIETTKDSCRPCPCIPKCKLRGRQCPCIKKCKENCDPCPCKSKCCDEKVTCERRVVINRISGRPSTFYRNMKNCQTTPLYECDEVIDNTEPCCPCVDKCGNISICKCQALTNNTEACHLESEGQVLTDCEKPCCPKPERRRRSIKRVKGCKDRCNTPVDNMLECCLETDVGRRQSSIRQSKPSISQSSKRQSKPSITKSRYSKAKTSCCRSSCVSKPISMKESFCNAILALLFYYVLFSICNLLSAFFPVPLQDKDAGLGIQAILAKLTGSSSCN